VTDNLDANMDRRAQRHPDSQMGLAHLLEVYDQHPGLVANLDATRASLAEAEEAVVVAEQDRDRALSALRQEEEARKRDSEQARKDKDSALKERESNIRGELQPRIDTLTAQLKEMTLDRDTLRAELGDYRKRAGKWADEVERLGKERRDVEEAERKAAEGRRTIAERLEGLEKGVLEGLRDVAEGRNAPTEKKDQGEKRDNVGGKKFVEGGEGEEDKARRRPRDNPWA
jgi:chromosome segregation ATPase